MSPHCSLIRKLTEKVHVSNAFSLKLRIVILIMMWSLLLAMWNLLPPKKPGTNIWKKQGGMAKL